MDEAPRRSGRATKGQHPKNVEPSARKATKVNRTAKTDADNEDDGSEIIRCICGAVEEDDEGPETMICCDKCGCWQHNECMEVTEDEDELPENYLCETCDPDSHRELLSKVGKGEKPWEERFRQRSAKESGKAGNRKRRRRTNDVGTKEVEENQVRIAGVPEEIPESSDLPRRRHPDTTESRRDTGNEVMPGVEPTVKTESIRIPSETVSGQKRKSGRDAKGKVETSPAPEDQRSKTRKVSNQIEKEKTTKKNHHRKASTSSQVARTDDLINQTELVANIEKLRNETRRTLATHFVKTMSEIIKRAQDDGTFTTAPEESAQSEVLALSLGLQIERAVHLRYTNRPGDPSTEARDRFRTISFNLKKNPVLALSFINGSLTPENLAVLSTDEMASKELRERDEEMKRAAEKQHILVSEEDGPRIRRTHKGEELVEDEHDNVPEEMISYVPPQRHQSVGESTSVGSPRNYSQSPTSATPPEIPDYSPNASEARPHRGTKPLNVDTSLPIKSNPASAKAPAFNMNDVWAHVPTSARPQGLEAQSPTEATPYMQSPIPAKPASVDSDIDRLLNDEDVESPPYSPPEFNEGSPVVWRGEVTMPGVTRFAATATHVAGADVSSMIPWDELVPPVVVVNGRISVDTCSEYLSNLRHSRNSDLVVIALAPISEGSAEDQQASQYAFEAFWRYFGGRDRYGVITKPEHGLVKDSYVVPIDKGSTELPNFLELLEQNWIPRPREDRMILIAYVVRKLPINSATSGPSTSLLPMDPTDAAGNGTTETGAAANPSDPFGGVQAETHPQGGISAGSALPITEDGSSLVTRVLGPFAQCHVFKEIPNPSALSTAQLIAIRDILERVPAARDNINLFGELLTARVDADSH
ncbi:MAG: hypothetical protein M1825_000009 [Sarcosagium campestre]|nr:MAG: hypothetical protein M1825_000009 [Sarcosagium campestre]